MESWRGSGDCLQSLVPQDCQGRFHWLGGPPFVVLAFPAHRPAHGLSPRDTVPPNISQSGPVCQAEKLTQPNFGCLKQCLSWPCYK
eukprot:1147834-Pelagomonas_calceolata.AAC.6